MPLQAPLPAPPLLLPLLLGAWGRALAEAASPAASAPAWTPPPRSGAASPRVLWSPSPNLRVGRCRIAITSILGVPLSVSVVNTSPCDEDFTKEPMPYLATAPNCCLGPLSRPSPSPQRSIAAVVNECKMHRHVNQRCVSCKSALSKSKHAVLLGRALHPAIAPR